MYDSLLPVYIKLFYLVYIFSAQITSETTVKHVKEPEESVYLELDDDLRYDYVTALVNPD